MYYSKSVPPKSVWVWRRVFILLTSPNMKHGSGAPWECMHGWRISEQLVEISVDLINPQLISYQLACYLNMGNGSFEATHRTIAIPSYSCRRCRYRNVKSSECSSKTCMFLIIRINTTTTTNDVHTNLCWHADARSGREREKIHHNKGWYRIE